MQCLLLLQQGINMQEIELLGIRLDTVRQLLPTVKSAWAQQHWAIIEAQLSRRYEKLLREHA